VVDLPQRLGVPATQAMGQTSVSQESPFRTPVPVERFTIFKTTEPLILVYGTLWRYAA
jgi:hypothetical protein